MTDAPNFEAPIKPEPQSDARLRRRIGQALELARDGAEIYGDRAGNVWVVTRGDQGGMRSTFLLPSSHFDEWLAFLVHDRAEFAPTLGEIRQVGRVLAGEARTRPTRALDIIAQEQVLELNPLVQVTVAFVEEQGGYYEGSTAVLRQKLTDLATTRGVNRRSSPLPSSTKSLSQRLKLQAPILAELGIAVTVKHTRKGSRTILERQPVQSDNSDEGESADPVAITNVVTDAEISVTACVTSNPLQSLRNDAGDASDAWRGDLSDNRHNDDGSCVVRVRDSLMPTSSSVGCVAEQDTES
jgi:hypothetical protein